MRQSKKTEGVTARDAWSEDDEGDGNAHDDDGDDVGVGDATMLILMSRAVGMA